MGNAGRHLAQGRKSLGPAEACLHLVQGRDVDVKSLVPDRLTFRIFDRNPPT